MTLNGFPPQFSWRALFAALTIVAGILLCPRADAAIIKFDTGLDPLFTYSGVSTIDGFAQAIDSGYHKVAELTGGTHGVAFNPFAVSPSEFFWADGSTDFSLDSFVIAGAWGSQTLTVNGYRDGGLFFTSPIAVTPSPTIFAPEWGMIDQLEIATGPDYTHTVDGGDGKQWVMDNLTIQTCGTASTVPEPASAAMLAMGFPMLLKRLRLRRPVA